MIAYGFPPRTKYRNVPDHSLVWTMGRLYYLEARAHLGLGTYVAPKFGRSRERPCTSVLAIRPPTLLWDLWWKGSLEKVMWLGAVIDWLKEKEVYPYCTCSSYMPSTVLLHLSYLHITGPIVGWIQKEVPLKLISTQKGCAGTFICRHQGW